jgi:methionyl-tRNA formyltransferase
MKIVFMGTPDFAVTALHKLHQAHDIVAVYTQPPRPAGRGKLDRKSPVHLAADALNLSVLHPVSLRSENAQQIYAAHAADIAVVVAYGLILPRAILDAPRLGCVNIHASLLPRWRGAAPIHRAVMAGDAQTGVCIMRMETGLDTGPVLIKSATPIDATDTTADLHDRLAAMGADLITTALANFGSLQPTPQPAEGVTYAAKIDKSEARIDWTRPAIEVDRQIRGLSPFPGAWCLIGDERVKLLRSRVVQGSGQPGQILHGLTIACGAGAVEITQAQREGKRPMDATGFLRGFGDFDKAG